MIGMDSFPPELLEQWCDDGSLPNLAALREEAAYGYIDSVADLFPGAVWTTFSSAQLPTGHGIYHFMQWDPATMTNAERDGVATFIVPWYRDGR